RLGRNADHHALVYLCTRVDEEDTAILRVEQPVSDRLARFEGDERTGIAAADVAFIGLIFKEDGVHDPFTLRRGEKFALISEQPAGGNEKFEAHARTDGTHVHEFALALAHALEHRARPLFGNVD